MADQCYEQFGQTAAKRTPPWAQIVQLMEESAEALTDQTGPEVYTPLSLSLSIPPPRGYIDL